MKATFHPFRMFGKWRTKNISLEGWPVRLWKRERAHAEKSKFQSVKLKKIFYFIKQAVSLQA
jgi:hypothetical protein